MPDKREHRGPHPADAELFAPERLASLRQAVADFSLLLTKGYADKSALKLVGDRFSLTQRQRLAVMRSACSDQQLQSRLERRVELADLAGEEIAIDGYNLLITIEAAMSGGLIFRGCDGCLRDLASIHGTYRKVEETVPALKLIGTFLKKAGIASALWLLDSPVSNSGRLKTLIATVAKENDWNWDIRLSLNPDAELRQTHLIVATSDSIVLDGCKQWVNLGAEIVEVAIPNARTVTVGN
ncbi:MAG: DUF434 domain-containing protein [Sedimentisphaerales bacterium]|nr:DUF434 domain-containing protein [Sedimentisphaerales bacterium]